jgi:hypothetical protein
VAHVYYEGAVPHRLSHAVVRLLVVEDVVVAAALALIAGSRPTVKGGCEQSAYAVVVIAALHLGYVGWVRPYRLPLEQWLVVAVAVGQLVVAVLVALVLHGQAALAKAETAGTAVDAMVMLQVVVLTVAALRDMWQQPQTEPAGQSLSMPVLAAGLVNSAGPAVVPPKQQRLD